MKIKITAKNEEKINSAIAKVEGKSTARCLNYDDVQGLVRDAEESLEEANCAKGERKGTMATRQDTVLSSYRWRAESTHIEITRGGTDWFLTGCSRGQCAGNSKSRSKHLRLSPMAALNIKQAAVRNCEANI